MNLNRKKFIRTIALALGTYTLFPQKLLPAKENNDLTQLILSIGNTNGEKERTQLLEKALRNSTIAPAQKETFEKLFFISDRWANGFDKYAIRVQREMREVAIYVVFFRNVKSTGIFFPGLKNQIYFFH